MTNNHHKPVIGVVVPPLLRDRLLSTADRGRLEALGAVRYAAEAERDEALALLEDAEVGVGSWGTVYPDAALLAACPKLRLWVHAAGTVKHMFGPHVAERELAIVSCGQAIAESVAEMVLGQLIVGLKRIDENARANRLGRQPKPANARTLAESTIGVVGVSNVGRRVIRNLRPFKPNVLVYDPYLEPAAAQDLGVTVMDDLTALCRRCDAVTLHTPALPSTRGLMGAEQFQAMPDDAVFINTSRGVCVDERALIAELSQGRLKACLDVTEPEPAAADSPFRKLPNVMLTSHIAGMPHPWIGQWGVNAIAAYLQGQPPAGQVTANMLEHIA